MQIDQVVMRLKVPKFLWQIDENDAMRLATVAWYGGVRGVCAKRFVSMFDINDINLRFFSSFPLFLF